MSSVAGPSGSAAADAEGSTQRQTLDCVAAFARASRVYRDATAQPGDRGLTRSAVREALEECLARSQPLIIDVSPTALLCRGCPPAEMPDDDDAVPSRLHQAGIRQVMFTEVPEDEPLDRMLATMFEDESASADLDRASRLWACDLKGVRWVERAPAEGLEPARIDRANLAPWPACGTPGKARTRGPKAPPSDEHEEAEDWPIPTVGWTPPLPQTVCPPSERTQLLMEFEEHSRADRMRRGLGLLSDLIFQEASPVELRDTVTRVGQLLSERFERGDMELAVRVLTSAQEALHRHPATAALHGDERDHLWASLVHPEAVGRGVTAYERQADGEGPALLTLIDELEEPSTDALCEILLHSEQIKTRRRACQRLIQVCSTSPQRLRRWLARPEWFLARNLAYVLANIPQPAAEEMLLFLVRHGEARVRRECVAGLAGCRSTAARAALVALTEDADLANRLGALQALQGTRDPLFAGTLRRRINDRMFASLPAEERAALVETLGYVGGPDQVPVLEALLTEFTPLDRRDSDPVADAAARGLAALDTDAGWRVLKRSAKNWSRPVRRAAERVLGETPKDDES